MAEKISETVTYGKNGDIAVITVDNPPVNAFNQSMRQGVIEAVARAQADGGIKALLIHGAGRTFIAGADIKEFDSGVGEPGFYQIFNTIENCPKPVVIAIHGTALGAGVELALACHYRCGVAGARVGLPELTLGIIPGAGGTQRLPRLIGARKALKFIIDARPVDVSDAAELGIVDRIFEGDPLEGALDYTRELVAAGAGPRKTCEMTIDTEGYDEAFLSDCRKQAGRFMRGQHAPERLIEAIQAAIDLNDFQAGIGKEKEIGDAMIKTDEAKSLRHIFFAERQITRIPGLSTDIKPSTIERVAIIGSGTMGGGIAMNFANVGVAVTLLDVSDEMLDKGLASIRKNYNITMKKGRLTAEQVEKRMGLISRSLNYEDLADADLVIEAVFEDMALKKEIFARLDKVCKPGAILSTNTSTLDIDEIAATVSRPEQVIGLHFFSPANVMRLVEIVRGAKTSKQVLATSVDIVKRIRKVGVVVGVCYGFVGNRMMLEGYFREADQLLLEGATPEQVDRVLYDFGFAMGPCAVNDMAGNDIGYKVRLAANAAERYPAPYHTVTDTLAARGWLGQKTGKGFYLYEPGDRTPRENAEVTAVIEEVAQGLGIERRQVSDEEILKRCIYSLINEGAKILEEGIAYRPGDIDVIWVNGYGFPRFRGGPMCYADSIGLKQIYETVSGYHQQFGHYWEPAQLLERLAQEGGCFSDWEKKVAG